MSCAREEDEFCSGPLLASLNPIGVYGRDIRSGLPFRTLMRLMRFIDSRHHRGTAPSPKSAAAQQIEVRVKDWVWSDRVLDMSISGLTRGKVNLT